ncbi:helix-turn-helix transcriptional regulator [Inquilinus sp. KBS0705]|nr:helix-turn-helix transcriptional regulator [Inquilinus sp. KBS0705]
MENHRGKKVEYIIKKRGLNIKDLAAEIEVNRRSMYNWFNQQELSPAIIIKIGRVIKHDFSKEFPELFSGTEFHKEGSSSTYHHNSQGQQVNWKQKYIVLLERYNSELLKRTSV